MASNKTAYLGLNNWIIADEFKVNELNENFTLLEQNASTNHTEIIRQLNFINASLLTLLEGDVDGGKFKD